MLQDLRFAFRSLGKNRGFAALAIVTLSLGIAVTTAFFTLIDVAALRGLPLQEPDRMIHVSTRDGSGRPQGVSYQDYEDLRRAVTTLEGLAAASQGFVALGDDDSPAERVNGAYVSSNALAVLGNTMRLGRGFSADDNQPGAPAVAILAFDIWKRKYGSHPSVVGRTVRINGTAATVIGVMPERFIYTGNTSVWLPLATAPGLSAQPRSARTLLVFGKLADGARREQAAGEIQTIARRLAADHPDTNKDITAVVVPMNQPYTQRISGSVWPVFITAGLLVLIIACANVANLLLARGVRRLGEMAVRTSLGATRWRIVRQLLAECLVLALSGGLLGIGLAFLGLRLFQSTFPTGSLPYWFDLRPSTSVLMVVAFICLGTVLVFSLVPAMHTSRANIQPLLTEYGRGGTEGRLARRWATVFLSAQLGLAFVLMAMITKTTRVEWLLERTETRVDVSSVATTLLALPPASYATPAERIAFYDRLLRDLRTHSDVSAASLASSLPFGGGAQRRLQIEGRSLPEGDRAPIVVAANVSPGYFDSLGANVARGRDFADQDGGEGRDSAIVNTRFAQIHFPGEDPIGRRIKLDTATGPAQPTAWLTIVGLSPVVLRQRAQQEPEPVVYLPFRATPNATAALLVKGASAAGGTEALRSAVRAIDPDVPLFRTMTLEQAMQEGNVTSRQSDALLKTIAVISALLALVGLYAVTAHAVSHQIRELGVRAAIGAGPRRLGWFVVRHAIRNIAFGVAAGAGLTFAWVRFFADSPVLGIGLLDPWTLGITAVAILFVGITACLSPARRAAGVSPIEAMRMK
jgi:putative ABC transport system permease protein